MSKKTSKEAYFLAIMFALCIYTMFAGPFDRSAVMIGSERVSWKGAIYVLCVGEYSEGKTIALTRRESFCGDVNEIKSVKEDNTHTFIVVRSFLDQNLFVREDYVIPKEGEITAAVWGRVKIADKEFCQAISDILEYDGDTFEYETEGIFMLTETQNMRMLYLAYEGCPIGTEFAGYLGKVNDIWVFAKGHIGTITCKVIPSRYISILQKESGKVNID